LILTLAKEKHELPTLIAFCQKKRILGVCPIDANIMPLNRDILI